MTKQFINPHSFNIPTCSAFCVTCYDRKYTRYLLARNHENVVIIQSMIYILHRTSHEAKSGSINGSIDNFDFTIRNVTIVEGSRGYLRPAVKDFLLHNTFTLLQLRCPRSNNYYDAIQRMESCLTIF